MKSLILSLILSIFSAAAFANTPLITEVTNDEGEHLVADSFSRTLYVFDLDIGKTTSQCDGVCAEVWPPYLLTPQEVPTLVAPLGSVVRTSGKVQLTYEGRPVYTYAPDRAIGDDTGDGVGGVWHYIEVDPVK